MPSETSASYSLKPPLLALPRQILKVAVITKSFHLLNHLLQIIRHFGQRLHSNFHRSIWRFSNDRVYLCELVVLIRIIIAKLRTATFLSLKGSTRNRLRYG